MKVLLLIPPVADATAPPLGVAALAAYLRRHGVKVSALDLNCMFLEFLACSPLLEQRAEAVVARFRRLDGQAVLSVGDRVEYRTLVDLHLFCMSGQYRHALDQLRTLRDRSGPLDLESYRTIVAPFFVRFLQLASYGQKTAYRPLLRAEVPPEGGDDPTVAAFYEDVVLPALRGVAADVIGVSVCYADQFAHATLLARQIRRTNPRAFVVAGGTYASVVATDLLRRPPFGRVAAVDAVVTGEGERPLLQLIQALEHGRDLQSVSSLTYCTKEGPRSTAQADPPPLDQLPVADFSVLPLTDYASPRIVLPYRVGRGCYWNRCSFCSHYQTRRVSHLAAGKVVSDLAQLKAAYGTKHFYFTDDSLSASFLRSFAKLAATELPGLLWAGNVRCEAFLADEFIENLAISGCKALYLGVESASPRLLALVRKGIDADEAGRIIDRCHRHGIAVKLNIIQGLPTEDEADVRVTADFIRRHTRRCDLVALSRFRVFRGTEIARQPERFGLTVSLEASGLPTWCEASMLEVTRTEGLPTLQAAESLYVRRLQGVRLSSEYLTRMHHLVFAGRFAKSEFTEPRDETTRAAAQVGAASAPTSRLDPNVPLRLSAGYISICLSHDINDPVQTSDAGAATPQESDPRCFLVEARSLRPCKHMAPGWHEIMSLCTGELSAREIATLLEERCVPEDAASLRGAVLAGLDQLYQEGLLETAGE